MTDYRSNAIPTCACGVRLPESPLLSPATGKPVCASCHAKDHAQVADLPEPQSRPREALRHLAMSLATSKGDPLLTKAIACPKCGGIAKVDDFRDHIEDLPIGRSYRHVCTACGKRFATETLWASVSRTLGASFLLGIAWFCWFTTSNVLAAAFTLLGLAAIAQRLVRIRNRWFKRRRARGVEAKDGRRPRRG